MKIAFVEFERIVKLLSHVSGPPESTKEDFPEWGNVLFCQRFDRSDQWAFYTNGSEILGLRIAIDGDPGQVSATRTDLRVALQKFKGSGAAPDDTVTLVDGAISLVRSPASLSTEMIGVDIEEGLSPCLLCLPEAVGDKYNVTPSAMAGIVRTAGYWNGGGGNLWLNAARGVFACVGGIYWRSDTEIELPESRLGFSDFSGIMGLDASTGASCFLAAMPGCSDAEGAPWVGFEQEEAVYLSVRLTQAAMGDLGPERLERLVERLSAVTEPWLAIPRRAERRAAIKAFLDSNESSVMLISEDDRVVLAGEGRAILELPMINSLRDGALACNRDDLCRVLRQDFGVFHLSRDRDSTGLLFRQGESNWGVICSVSPS